MIYKDTFQSIARPRNIGHQPVSILLTIKEADPLVQDHDGEQAGVSAAPAHLGSVSHVAGDHGVSWSWSVPGPPHPGQRWWRRGELGRNNLDNNDT